MPLAAAQELVRRDGPDARARPAARRGRRGDARRRARDGRLRARCATATAACATSSSGSPSPCRTARWPRRAGASSRTSPATTSASSSPARSARSGCRSTVALRLHPLPRRDRDRVGLERRPGRARRRRRDPRRAPLEADCLDVAWRDGARAPSSSASAARRAERQAGARRRPPADGAASRTSQASADDDALWAAQRDGQRSAAGAVLQGLRASRGPRRPSSRAARDAGAQRRRPRRARTVAGSRSTGDDLAAPGRGRPRARSRPRACTLQDAPEAVRTARRRGASPTPARSVVMRRVKERFDPARIFSPGSFVGGI